MYNRRIFLWLSAFERFWARAGWLFYMLGYRFVGHKYMGYGHGWVAGERCGCVYITCLVQIDLGGERYVLRKLNRKTMSWFEKIRKRNTCM